MSKMESDIWVSEPSDKDGIRLWRCGGPKAECDVPYIECPPTVEGVLLAVEAIPGFGYGVIGLIEIMSRPDIDGNLYDGCDGYAAFYRRKP